MKDTLRRVTPLATGIAVGLILMAGCTSSPSSQSATDTSTSLSAASAAAAGVGSTDSTDTAAPSGSGQVSPSAPGVKSALATGTGSTPAASTSATGTGSTPAASISATGGATPAGSRASATDVPAAATSDPSSYAGGTPASSAPTVSIPPRATTPVPAPGGGNIKQTVANAPRSTQAPVPVSATASYDNGVSAQLAEIKKINTTPQLPGEIGGPGVAVSVQIRNGSRAPIDLSTVTVDLQDTAGVPASPMSASPAKPVAGQLAAGAMTTGTYVFSFPPNYRKPDRLTVSYSAQAPVVLFTGTIS